MSSVIVLIGTPDPDDRPPTSAEWMREYEREWRNDLECRKARYALGWRQLLDLVAVIIEEGNGNYGEA